MGAQVKRLDVGREGQAEWDGEPEESSSTAERERAQRGDLDHVIREWESKAMVQGRGAFQGPKEERWEQWRRRRGGGGKKVGAWC